jgi:hypothetical protein
VAPQRPVRSKLADWLRRLSARAVRVAATLDRSVPDAVPPDATVAPDGPPEHWLRMVAERAPELLDGRGIGSAAAVPRLPGPLRSMHDAEASADRLPSGGLTPGPDNRSVATDGSSPGSVPDRSVPGGLAASAHDAAPVDRTARVARGAVASTLAAPPTADQRSSEAGARRVSTVDPTASQRRASPDSAVSLPLLRRMVTRLVPSRSRRPRRPVASIPSGPPRVTGTEAVIGEATHPRVTVARVANRSAPVVPSPGRTLRWPVNDVDQSGNFPTPDPAGAADPGPPGRSEPVLARRGEDRRPSGPPTRYVRQPEPRGADTRWPVPPSGGPWQSTAGPPANRWPALPDDSSLWILPVGAFPDARVRRLDDEQRGV